MTATNRFADSNRGHGPRREFLLFLTTGVAAALVNVLSRVVFSQLLSFELAVLFAYGIGMLLAYGLARKFVFQHRRVSVRRSFPAFALVNLLAVLQTCLVSVGLRNWLLPILGTVVLSDLIAHGIGVAVPVITSYFGHKHISFR